MRQIPASGERPRPLARTLHGDASIGKVVPGRRDRTCVIWSQGRWRCDHVHVPDDTVSWAEVAARLAAARSYWMCTTLPSGAPHTTPVWGVVTNRTLYLYSERRTVKARNLAADPRAVVHLESTEDVVIVRGIAEELGLPAQVPEVVTALSAKYASQEDRQYLPDADPDFDIIYALRPQSAMMWRLADYEGSQRRWTS
jgi:hypothetical protein